MGSPETSNEWRKSSVSGGNGECIELNGSLNAMRDSKNPDTVLSGQFADFIAAVKTGKLDR
jgi:hypothetical protein